jgi:hypothetical protein
MYLTHYGKVGDVQALGERLLEQLDEVVALGRRLQHAGAGRHAAFVEGLGALYAERARAHGAPQGDAAVKELFALDIELNAQGMAAWLDRAQRKAARAAARGTP